MIIVMIINIMWIRLISTINTIYEYTYICLQFVPGIATKLLYTVLQHLDQNYSFHLPECIEKVGAMRVINTDKGAYSSTVKRLSNRNLED